MTQKKFLVTGATVATGGYAVERLRERGHAARRWPIATMSAQSDFGSDRDRRSTGDWRENRDSVCRTRFQRRRHFSEGDAIQRGRPTAFSTPPPCKWASVTERSRSRR